MLQFTKRVGIGSRRHDFAAYLSTITVMKHLKTAENSLNELLQDTSSGGIACFIIDLVEQDRLTQLLNLVNEMPAK